MKRMKKFIGILLFVLTFGLASTITIPQIGTCVDVQAATVSLNKKSTSVYIGKTTQLKVNNYTGKIKWTSSNTSIATVSSTGKVKGKKAGTVTISARAGKKTLKCKVSVRSVIRVSPKEIYLDGTDDATITVTLKKNCDVSYSVSNSGIISCSWDDDWYKGGKETYLYITGERTGTTYITITNKYNNEKARIKVVVDLQYDDSDDDVDDDIDNDNNTFVKLRNYILTYGDTNRAGNKFIHDNIRDDDGYLWTWCIIVNNNNQIEFMVAQDRTGDTELSNTYGELYIDSNLNAYVKYEYSMFGEDGTVSAIANVNSRTYTENTKLTYRIVENDLYPYASSGIPKVADSMLRVGFAGWKELLDQTGVTFRNLGFSSLVIS